MTPGGLPVLLPAAVLGQVANANGKLPRRQAQPRRGRTIAKLFDCRRPALRQRDSRLGTVDSRVRGNDRLEAYSIVWKDFAIFLAQILEGIDMALDEGGGVCPPDQLHIAGPGPAQRHHEHPDGTLAAVLVQVGQAAPVDLSLLSGRRLETHRGIRLPASPAQRHVGLQDGISAVIAQGLDPGAGPRSFPVPRTPAGQRIPYKRPASMPASAGASASWHRVISGISGPCSGRRPIPRRPPVWSGPLPSSRRSLSLVPPSAKSAEHLHEDFVNDAPTIGWVNATPAISLIFSSAVTRCHVQQ